jgi:hypothetical protein
MIDTNNIASNKVQLKTGQESRCASHPINLYDEYCIDEMKDMDFDAYNDSATPRLDAVNVLVKIKPDANQAQRRISGISNYDEYELDDPIEDDSTTTSLEDEHVEELPIKGITKQTKRMSLIGMHFSAISNYNEYDLDDENDDQTDSMTGISLYNEYGFEDEKPKEAAPKKRLSLTGVSNYNEYDCDIHQDEIETVGISLYDEYDYDDVPQDHPVKRPPTPFVPRIVDIMPPVMYPIAGAGKHSISSVFSDYDEYDCDSDSLSSLG